MNYRRCPGKSVLCWEVVPFLRVLSRKFHCEHGLHPLLKMIEQCVHLDGLCVRTRFPIRNAGHLHIAFPRMSQSRCKAGWLKLSSASVKQIKLIISRDSDHIKTAGLNYGSGSLAGLWWWLMTTCCKSFKCPRKNMLRKSNRWTWTLSSSERQCSCTPSTVIM